MVDIVMIDANGEENVVKCSEGETLMHAAVREDVPGIVGECGGCLACATCHVYVDEEWEAALEPMGDMEDALLDGALTRKSNSRLGCQITVTSSLDGLKLHIPEHQI